MNYDLSVSASKKLKEWGCDVPTVYAWGNCYNGERKPYVWDIYTKTKNGVMSSEGNRVNQALYIHGIPTYNLRDIICNGEMAKAFFGEYLLCYDCGEKVGAPLGNDRIQIGTGTCTCNRNFENNEEACEFHAKQMIWYTQQGKKEEAEKYLLDNTIFNPKNK